jgi:hypothetical protein
VNCPHCKKPITARIVAQLAKETEIQTRITIAEGHMLMAKTVGGLLTDWEALLRAVAKDLGGKSEVFVKEIALAGRKLTFTFVVTGQGKDVTHATIGMIKAINGPKEMTGDSK